MSDLRQTANELGKGGEAKARIFLKQVGFSIQQVDWIGKLGSKWICFEIKNKAFFKAKCEEYPVGPDWDGQGLNIYQVKARLILERETGIMVFLLIFDYELDKTFGQWLTKLEEGEQYNTSQKIRIYPLTNYLEGENNIKDELEKYCTKA